MFEDSENYWAKTIAFWFVLSIILRVQAALLMATKLDEKTKGIIRKLLFLLSLIETILILKFLPLYNLIDENSGFRMLMYFLFPVVITLFVYYFPLYIEIFEPIYSFILKLLLPSR